jgi:hypothetical protein
MEEKMKESEDESVGELLLRSVVAAEDCLGMGSEETMLVAVRRRTVRVQVENLEGI